MLLGLARWRGTRVVWTIHDLGSNDQLHPRLERMFWSAFVPRVDGFICLTEGGRRDALERFPELAGRPSAVIPHGHYLDAYPSGIGRGAARAQLGLDPDGPVVLHFGLIRPYKNVPHLVSVFRQAAIPGAVLVIGGRPFDDNVEREVRAAAEGATGVRLDLRFIGSDEVQAYFEAADLVVLPYSHVTNSGAIFLALSFRRPVLVPDLGAMGEHARDFGADWVSLYRGTLESADLAAAVLWARETERGPLDMSPLAWDEIARQTRRLYRRVTEDPTGGETGSVADEDRR